MVHRFHLRVPIQCTLVLAAVALLAGGSLCAQPLLDFRRIEVRYPEISLTFRVLCDSVVRRDMGPQNFEVRENGILVKNVTLWCPPSDQCCVSASLVFDRSGSMLGQKMARVREGGMAYLGQMNPDGHPCDEASIVSFNQYYTLDAMMTSDTAVLGAAVRRLSADGRTAVWDATGEGIRQLLNAKNLCKAVVLLSDGGDNSSMELPDVNAVIQLALAYRVKVFTIGYGIKSGSPEESDLQRLAYETGGAYFHSETGQDFAELYAMIRNLVQDAYNECTISYESGCPDGSVRTVELTLKDYCGRSTVRQSRTYVAPYNPSKFKKVQISLGSASGQASRTVMVPVVLDTPVDGVFSAGDFTVIYDRRFAQMTGVTAVGGLLEGVPLSMRDIGSGHTITIGTHKEISGKGTLCWLQFRLADVVNPEFVQIWLFNWNMTAYCLSPQLENGMLSIYPRTAELDCRLALPDSLVWNDDLRDFDGNPFTVSATVTNSGTRDGEMLRARILLPDAGFTLVNPTTDEQTIQPSSLPPGATTTVSWDVRALRRDTAAAPVLCIEISAANHPAIRCCATVRMTNATAPALACTLTAPDTVWFREQYYEPEAFDVGVDVVNTGTGKAHDVNAQLLQDTRFTILGDAAAALASVLPPGGHAGGSFRVRMHPRETDGYDTLRVNVQGNDTDPTWCLHPVWVQRVRAPRFTLACTATPDSLVFSETAGGYEPNPFTVTTIAENVGETYAEECELMFVGPPRFTPVGGNLRPLGTMQIRDARTELWSVRALPRAAAGWDTLHFQVLGKGGLGRAIVIADCRAPIHVPAMRAPAYTITCDVPAALVFDQGRYTPDPFTLTVRIHNSGTASGHALRPALVLPQGLRLAPGETPDRFIDWLPPDSIAVCRWQLTPVPRTTDSSLRLCARIIDSVGASAECCSDIAIPRATAPVLTLGCAAIDTLFLDPISGMYLGNPFEIVATVRNGGTAPARTVVVTLTALGAGLQVLDPVTQDAGDLNPGAWKDVRWRILAQPRMNTGSVSFDLTAGAANHGEVTCRRSIHIPARRVPQLEVFCGSTPEDSLRFDWNTGEFVSSDVTVRLRARNIGGARAVNASAMFVAPEGTVLAAGETPLKPLVPADLDPGAEGTASWRVTPLRNDADAVRQFRFTVRTDNAPEVECLDPLWIQGSPRAMTIWIPRDVLLKYGQKSLIPVIMDRSIGKDLASYDVEVAWDPSVLAVHGVTSEGTMTGLGWTGARLHGIAPGRVRISDYTTTSPLRSDTGVVVWMQVEGVYRSVSGAPQYGFTELRIDPASANLNHGGIRASTVDGSAWVTGDCLVPLYAAPGFVLAQNRPNPFNPSTVIAYELPEPGHIRLTVHDATGRELLVADEGERAAGRHEVRVDANGLRSGTYFYRLVSAQHSAVRAMIIAR